MVDRISKHNTGQGSVAILFREDMVSALFAELIEAQGVPVRIIESTQQIGSAKRLITEVHYYSQIPLCLIPETLIVGNKDSLTGLKSQCLSRPLTEQKVEAAIERFLS